MLLLRRDVLSRVGVDSVLGIELQFPKWYQICSRTSCGLLGRMPTPLNQAGDQPTAGSPHQAVNPLGSSEWMLSGAVLWWWVG